MAAGPVWRPDLLAGFEARTLPLRDEGDHPVATLVRRRAEPDRRAGRAVLFVHGFSDYFFHPHVADAYRARGFDAYALDLRRYGRSLRPGQRAFACRSLDDYFEELTLTLATIAEEVAGPVVLVAHSTGGLVAALYARRGERRDDLAALVLNSPFLALPVPAPVRALAPAVGALGRVAPGLPVARLPGVYARSLHRAHGGPWDFDPAWKPTTPTTVRAGWLRAVLRAQAEVRRGLGLRQPVLVLRAGASRRTRRFSGDLLEVDAVLDVASIERLAPRLGPDVTQVAIPGAVHDVTLSRPEARAAAIDAQLDWLAARGLA